MEDIKVRNFADFTIEQALQAYEMGLSCICADGKLKCLRYERIGK